MTRGARAVAQAAGRFESAEPDCLRSPPIVLSPRLLPTAAESPSRALYLPRQRTANRTPAGFLLLASKEAFCSSLPLPLAQPGSFFASLRVQFESGNRSCRSKLAQDAQAVCARSDGRIEALMRGLKGKLFSDCDKTVWDGDLLWKGVGKVGRKSDRYRQTAVSWVYTALVSVSSPVFSSCTRPNFLSL